MKGMKILGFLDAIKKNFLIGFLDVRKRVNHNYINTMRFIIPHLVNSSYFLLKYLAIYCLLSIFPKFLS